MSYGETNKIDRTLASIITKEKGEKKNRIKR